MHSQKYLKSCAQKFALKLLKTKKNKKFFNTPFKHLIIDNLIDENFAKKCMQDFPSPPGGFEGNWRATSPEPQIPQWSCEKLFLSPKCHKSNTEVQKGLK